MSRLLTWIVRPATSTRTTSRSGCLAIETTTEVDQVDDNYVAHDAKYWNEQNIFPCRWNMAPPPSPFCRKAMGGEVYEEENRRCEEVMAQALGR